MVLDIYTLDTLYTTLTCRNQGSRCLKDDLGLISKPHHNSLRIHFTIFMVYCTCHCSLSIQHLQLIVPDKMKTRIWFNVFFLQDFLCVTRLKIRSFTSY